MDTPAFFAAVRADPFGGALSQSAVDGIEAILAAWDTYGDGDQNKLAYILATSLHESDRFKTMHEYWGPTEAQKKYEGRDDLGNTEPGDGERFMGRGFVQVTGRRNYTAWSKRLGIDLVADPERAAEHEIAARILVEGMMLGTFTGKPLGKYVGAGCDFYNARRVVNGLDRADLISRHALAFKAALQAATTSRAPVSRPTMEDRLVALEGRVTELEARG
jgi:putative chitinase